MIAIDTNVLVRILVDDPGQMPQVQRARALASGADKIYIPQVVQAETVWVLEGAYELARDVIVEVLEHLAMNEAFELEVRNQFVTALGDFRSGSADFADYLILARAKREGCELATFDRNLAKHAGAITP